MRRGSLAFFLFVSVACAGEAGIAQVLPGDSSAGNKGSRQPQVATNPSAQDLFRQLSKSCFKILMSDEKNAPTATGSGVAVGPEEVVTNKHVVAGGTHAVVEHGEKTWKASLVCLDPKHDLAKLYVPGLNAQPVKIRLCQSLEIGEKVYAIGSPKGYEETLSDGLLSALREYDGAKLIQTSAPISHGSSGGGLFDASGRLIGITSLGITTGQNLNFAIPCDFVNGLNQFPVAGETGLQAWPASLRIRMFNQLGDEFLIEKRNDPQRALFARDAAGMYSHSLKLNSNQPIVWNNMGTAYLLMHKSDKAILAFKSGLKLKPDYPKCFCNLGIAYCSHGDLVEAQEIYNRLLSTPGADPEPLKKLERMIADKLRNQNTVTLPGR